MSCPRQNQINTRDVEAVGQAVMKMVTHLGVELIKSAQSRLEVGAVQEVLNVVDELCPGDASRVLSLCDQAVVWCLSST